MYVYVSGSMLATASGDSTTKLWDLSRSQVVHSFTDNTLAVWSVNFDHSGDFFATASLDQTARIFDVTQYVYFAEISNLIYITQEKVQTDSKRTCGFCKLCNFSIVH